MLFLIVFLATISFYCLMYTGGYYWRKGVNKANEELYARHNKMLR